LEGFLILEGPNFGRDGNFGGQIRGFNECWGALRREGLFFKRGFPH